MQTVARSKLLYRSKVEYASYGLNHYLGCAHNCAYCWSRKRALRFHQCASPQDWANPKIVKDAVGMLEREVSKRKWLPNEWIWLNPATDPYQPIEDEVHLTRGIIQFLVNHNIPVRILTKSVGVLHDQDLILKHPDLIQVGFSVTTLDDELRQKWESHASPIWHRVRALEWFHNHGIKTWCSLEPILDDHPEQILHTLQDDVDMWYIGKLNYVSQPLVHYNRLRERIIKWFNEHHMTNYLIKKELRDAD